MEFPIYQLEYQGNIENIECRLSVALFKDHLGKMSCRMKRSQTLPGLRAGPWTGCLAVLRECWCTVYTSRNLSVSKRFITFFPEDFPYSSHIPVRIGGETRMGMLIRDHFAGLAKRCDLNPQLVLSELSAMAKVLPKTAQTLVDELNISYPRDIFGNIAWEIGKLCRQVHA